MQMRRRPDTKQGFPGATLVAAVAVGALLSCSAAFASEPPAPIVFCDLAADLAPTAPAAGGMLPASYGDGARLTLLEPDGTERDLAPDFASACDPDVSFDGERILFAGQREAGDPWNIWEIKADGTRLRQVTNETLDARNPIYLATFYTITSSEPWYTILFVRDDGVFNQSGTAPSTSLYTVRLDGSELRRITFHPGNDRTPYLMKDGLLLFAGWRTPFPSDGSGGRIGLYGVQTDGIDYAAYGAGQGARIQHMPTQPGDGTILFIEADRVDWAGAGGISTVDTQRPHHSYRPVTDGDDGLFHSPSPLGDGSVLVSHRRGDEPYRIVRFSTAEGIIQTLWEAAERHGLHARAVAGRPEPDGRSSTVRPESPIGKLFGLDVYESDARLSALERGSARTVRVIEGLPAARAAAGHDIGFQRRLLGEAPIEEDGSFHVDIPADLPVQLQLLDEDGLALSTCDWIWVKQREFRGCIGCHEDPELTPPNRFVQAAGRPATPLYPEPSERRTVGFREHIRPTLGERCVSCHQPDGTAAVSGLVLERLDDLDGARSLFETLTSTESRLIVPGSARTSPLVWRLLGRDTSRPWDRNGGPATTIPTDHAEILEPSERKLLIEWIDLGAPWTTVRTEEGDR